MVSDALNDSFETLSGYHGKYLENLGGHEAIIWNLD